MEAEQHSLLRLVAVSIFLTALRYIAGIVCLAAVSLWLYSALWPADEVLVRLPGEARTARIQVWASWLSDGRFQIAVGTPHGTLRRVMWEDWGPAQRTNLYLTAEGWLVALGAGTVAAAIALPDGHSPRLVPPEDLKWTRSETWTFLGTVDRANGDLTFFRPSDMPECIPLYAEGRIDFRKDHQDTGNC